jgi:hypothetical protein
VTAGKPNAFEEKRAAFKETDRAAREIIASEGEATRKKTAKLKAQRLAKEAERKR